jgi:preprotein translocase subunit YajC
VKHNHAPNKSGALSIMKSLFTYSIASIAASAAFITPAFAEAGASDGGGFASLIPLVLIMVIFYFLLIRPQQKKVKEHRDTVETLKKGDKVLTGGGIFATVTDVQEDALTVKIAEGVTIKVKKDTVAGVIAKPTAGEAKEKKAAKKAAKGKAAKKQPAKEQPAIEKSAEEQPTIEKSAAK